MKIFKSIKWRLQLWYGLILVVVLAGFGFTSYQLERGRQVRRRFQRIRGMPAHCRIDIGVLLRQCNAPPAGFKIDADGDYAGDPRRPGTVEQRGQIAGEAGIAQVGMRVVKSRHGGIPVSGHRILAASSASSDRSPF